MQKHKANIRILLVEDNAIVRQLTNDMLIMQDDFDVVGEAEDGFAALDLLKNGIGTDIILADLNMPGMDGIELTENITAHYDSLKVIVITMHAKAAYFKRAMAAGARGYLLKTGNMNELYNAIRRVSSGEMFIGENVNTPINGAA